MSEQPRQRNAKADEKQDLFCILALLINNICKSSYRPKETKEFKIVSEKQSGELAFDDIGGEESEILRFQWILMSAFVCPRQRLRFTSQRRIVNLDPMNN